MSKFTRQLKIKKLSFKKSPLEIFSKLYSRYENAYMLESIEGPKKLSQYSFIGFDPALTIKIKNGEAVTRNEITVNKSTDTLTDIANAISGISGLNASVASSKLNIQADANYEFDFLPAVLPLPTASTLTGSPPTISVSGIYTGTSNDTFQFRVVGTGSVSNGTLQLEVRDGAAQLISILNVGSGYAAGDKLDLGNGIKISLSSGSLNAGETFDVDAFSAKVAFIPLKNTYIELVEPTNPEDGLGKFLHRGGGMHHICYEVDNLDDIYGELKKKNIREVSGGIQHTPCFGKALFLHPKDTGNVLIEVVERATCKLPGCKY